MGNPAIKSKPGIYETVESLIRHHVKSCNTLLEIAGGAGIFCERVKDICRSTITSDIVPPKNHQARSAVCFDANGFLPLKTGSVDVVVCVDGFEHLDAQLKFLSETARVLSAGGWLVLSTPNIVSLDERRRFYLEGVPDSLTPEIREGVLPPDPDFYEMHISLVHPLVMELFFKRVGLSVVEYATNKMSRRFRHIFQRLPMWIHLLSRRRKYEKQWGKPFPATLTRLNADPIFLYGNSLIVIARKSSP